MGLVEELVVPEVGLELAADESHARLVPCEHGALAEPDFGFRRGELAERVPYVHRYADLVRVRVRVRVRVKGER